MRHARILVLLGCSLLMLALVACDQQRGGPRVVGEDGTEIEITATPAETGTATIVTPSEPTGTPTGTASPTATSEATGTPPSASPTSTPTDSAAPSSGDGTGVPGLQGMPYSTADVRAAVEAAGRTFLVDDEREPICPDTSVPETVFWAASAGGSDYGPNWALWVYPDEEAREQDWELEDGQLAPTTDDCELPTGFNYFNANVVMAFVSWQGPDSESTFDAERSPREDAALEAFLELGTPEDEDEED